MLWWIWVKAARLILEGYGVTVKRIRGREWLYAQKRIGKRIVTKCLSELVTTEEASLGKPSPPPPGNI